MNEEPAIFKNKTKHQVREPVWELHLLLLYSTEARDQSTIFLWLSQASAKQTIKEK